MIKEILEQLAPLDAQITALKGSGDDMDAITAHASELAELAVEEDEILSACGPLTAEDRSFWPGTRTAPTLTRPSPPCSPTSLSSGATASAGRTPPSWAVWPASTAYR